MPHWIFNLCLVFAGYIIGGITGYGLAAMLSISHCESCKLKRRKGGYE